MMAIGIGGEVAWYCPSLDDSGNGTTTLTDLTVGAANGTLTNMDAATDWVADTERRGVRALDFDGVNDSVSAPVIAALNTTNFTASGWVYRRTTTARIVERYFNESANDGWTLYVLTDGTAQSFIRNNSGFIIHTISSPVGVVSANNWHHVAVVKNGATGYLYVDGVEVASGTYGFATPLLDNSIRIGATDTGDQFFYSDARIDDVRIFNRVLSPAEIRRLASRRGVTRTIQGIGGEVAWWCPSLDPAGFGTTTLTDLTGNGRTGTLTNMDAATDWVRDYDEQGDVRLDFDGSNDHVVVSHDASLALNEFSVTLWHYWTSSINNNVLINKQVSSTTQRNYYMLRTSTGDITAGFTQGVSTYRTVVAPSVATGQWVHVAHTYTSGSHRLYIDGVLIDEDTGHTGNPDAANTNPLYIGSLDASTENANVRLDDVRVFNRAITAREVELLASRRGYLQLTSLLNHASTSTTRCIL